MKLFSARRQNCNPMLKISIFLSAAVVLAVIVQHVDSQATSNTTRASDGQSVQNDLNHQVNKAKAVVPSGRAGRMLDLDRLAGDVGKSSSVSGNRQSRSGEIEERSKKASGSKKMKINGFIPIVSMEGATHLAGLTGGSNSNDDTDDDNNDEASEQQQQQQSNLREHLATSYGGATSIGHASFPIANQQQQQQQLTGGEQQWQQVDPSQPQVFSASSLSGVDPSQSAAAADSARANRKLLGSSNLFAGMTLGQPGRRGLVSSLIPSGLSLGGGGGQAGGNYYPQQAPHANYHQQGQSPLAGPMNVPLQSSILEQGDGCICVPFFQCKNGHLSESQLSKSQLSQLNQLGATTAAAAAANSFGAGNLIQVPRSSSTGGQANDLYYNSQMVVAGPQQYTDTTGQQPTSDAASQQQVMNDIIYEQLRKNMESGQLEQQMQPTALLDERAASKANSSAASQTIEERSLFNLGLSQRRSYQTRSCGIMRTCCKVPVRMTSGGNQMAAHLSAARFINPVGHLQQQQLIASPSVGRPQTSQNQYQNHQQQQQQQQLAHRYLQTRPSRMSNPANDYYPPTVAQQHQNHQLDSTAYQQPLAPAGPSQPMVIGESIMQQQQQQQPPSHQTALVSRPPGSAFMSGRCGLRQTLGIAGRVQNAPVAQGLEPGESSADFGEFPAHAAILKRISPGDSLFVCSAVLISSQWLATAAHCVRKHRPDELKVRLGEWDVARDDEFYPFFETSVREIVLNPDFQPTSLANDIALIRLEQAVDGQQMPHVAPACLAQPDEGHAGGYAGQRCWVAGWGKNAFGQQGTFQSVLKKVDLPVVSHADCELALKYQTKLGKFFRLHQNNICAGGERGKDACEGDGGAGLYCLEPHSQLIKAIGLVSWGVGCGQRGVPGVYVNLANFNNWIEQVVVSSGEENVYALMDGRMSSANGSADFKNIISERTNDKAAVNGTLAPIAQQQQDQQEGRSMGAAVAASTRANETETITTTTVTPKTI